MENHKIVFSNTMQFFKIKIIVYSNISKSNLLKMVKLVLSLVISFFLIIVGFGQSGVFVLVDVSASGPSSEFPRADAKRITKELITGNYKENNFPDWEWSGEQDIIIENIRKGNSPSQAIIDVKKDNYIMVMPFGIKNRYKDYRIEKVENLQEVEQFLESYYPSRFKDQQTYIEIARAMAASIAKSKDVSISSYYLFEIWDGLPDTNSKLPGYTKVEEGIKDSYGGKNAREITLGTYRYRGGKK